jgi:hypothetical protein
MSFAIGEPRFSPLAEATTFAAVHGFFFFALRQALYRFV